MYFEAAQTQKKPNVTLIDQPIGDGGGANSLLWIGLSFQIIYVPRGFTLQPKFGTETVVNHPKREQLSCISWIQIYVQKLPRDLESFKTLWALATPSTTRFTSQTHRMLDPLLHQYILMGVTTQRGKFVHAHAIALLFWEMQNQSRTRFRCGQNSTIERKCRPSTDSNLVRTTVRTRDSDH